MSAATEMNSDFVLICRSHSFRLAAFHLPHGATIIGRSSACDFVVRHETISRQHAEIRIDRQQAMIRDLKSRNGTFLNGRQVEESPLVGGAELRMGDLVFLVSSDAVEEFDSDQETHRVNAPARNGVKSCEIETLRLTPAQRRVLDMLLDLMSEQKIAAALDISPLTVHTHVKEIYRNAQVHSRAELIAKFMKPVRRTEK
jgi:pSer/pThr/pTyr-binding forkhead associated (FHA) protein